jgi:hypothetical protein
MINFRFILLFSSLVLLNFYTSAQYPGCYTKAELERKFLKTKTLVFLTGDADFDANIKKGMEEFWTLTEYEFVDDEKLNKIGYSTEYSVMQPYKMNRIDNLSSQMYNYWGVFLPADKGSGAGMKNIVAEVQLDGFGREKDFLGATYRGKHLVKFLHDAIVLRLEDQITCKYCHQTEYFLRTYYFNQKAQNVSTKTLLVDEHYLTNGVKETFAKKYPGKVKFVSTEEIEEAINNNEEGYCYLLPIFTLHKYVYIVDVVSGEIYCMLYSQYGMEFTSKDVKKIAKMIFK